MENQEPLNQDLPAGEEKSKKKLPGKKIGLIAGITVGVLAAAYTGICIAAAAGHTVFGKTDVLGVDVSGLTKQQVQETWEAEAAGVYQSSGISVLINGEEVKMLSLDELGATVTGEDAAQAAWNAGHGGNFITNGAALIRSWFEETPTVPHLTVDEEVLGKTVDALTKELSSAPINGTYRVDAKKQDGFYVTKPADGRQVDGAALKAALVQELEEGRLTPVKCQYGTLGAKGLDLDAISKKLEKAVNSKYDKKTGGVTKSRPSVSFDVAEAQKLLEQAQCGEEIVIPAKVQAAAITEEKLQQVMFRDVLGSYTTSVGGTWERKTNVRLAAANIDGYIMNSGDDFYYNQAVGQRTTARGFQAAPAYVGGKTVDEVGGGICQVSSTLYYAAMLANLKIVEREEHMYAPSYITFGCDATVSWGGPEFAFRNNTDYPIKIVTYYSGDTLTVEIYGTKVDDTYVRIISETLSQTDYKVVYQKTDELKKGVEQVEQYPYTGYYVETWRNVYSGNGDLISSTFEASSDYCARDEIIKVGTKVDPVKPAVKPDPPATPNPPEESQTPEVTPEN